MRAPWRLGWRWVVAFLLADVLAGSVLWHLAGRHADSPVSAVTKVADLAGQGDWNGVYSRLCNADHQQFTAAEVSAGGTSALQLLHGLAGVRITNTHVVAVHLVGPLSLPAEQVSGTVLPGLGQQSDFHVTTVRELTGWKMCLSVGGYGASAFGVDVPLGS